MVFLKEVEMNLKGCIQYHTYYIKRVKCISLLESFGSLSDFISDFIVVAESSCKIFEKLIVNLLEIFLGGMMLEGNSGVWV